MVAMKTYVAARRKTKLTTLSCSLQARRENQATAKHFRMVFTKLHLKKCTQSSTEKTISVLPVSHNSKRFQMVGTPLLGLNAKLGHHN